MNVKILFLALLPFIGTVAGAAGVFFFRKIGSKTEKILYGFASGVMMAASVWSLLIPAEEMSKDPKWLPCFIGFVAGAGFLMLLDFLVLKYRNTNKTAMLTFAVTLHNLPEGMAVGVVLAGLMQGAGTVSFSDAFALSLGIAIQNFPEGAIISLPKRNEGRLKAFTAGTLSGVVEPIGAGLTLLLVSHVTAFLPYLLAFAAGAMIYVVAEELIPEAHDELGMGTIGATTGFAMMMLLDMALG
ncbi:MAG: ZIP family metal transporter [Ruminococcaceae bacterium]|nr:ZIP family metal transporter [Oscillospiraceae bacterium]